MFGWFRKEQRPSSEKRPMRELHGLMACIVAWRRAVMEAQLLNHGTEAESLEERRELLGLYAEAAGGAGPFAQHILTVPVGSLPEPMLLDGLYRIETAVSIAWALGLVDAIPPIGESADYELLGSLFPTTSAPPPSIASARLRPTPELTAKLTEWRAACSAAITERQVPPGEETEIRFSRAYERVRGLEWVCSQARWIEELPG